MSIHNPLNAPEMRAMKAAIALEQLQAMGLDLDDLVALRSSGQLPGQMRLREYLPTVRRSAKPGKRKVYDSYWDLLDVGLPELCACFCPACLTASGAGPAGTALPCACRTAGSCSCPKSAFDEGPGVASCSDAFVGLGHMVLGQIVPTDVMLSMAWAKVRAKKRWARRNDKRAAKGRATFNYTGKSAEEHTRSAASAIFKPASYDPATGVKVNVALLVEQVKRPRTTAKAYTFEQLEELWNTIFTCGLSDPELAMLVWWFHLETGARRGGALSLRVSSLNLATQMVTLVEKKESVGDQPFSAELARALLGHALERGDIVVGNVEGLDPADVTVDDVIAGRATVRSDAPVFYFRRRRKVTAADGTVTTEPWPLSRRFYNTVWDRICAALPWADKNHIRPHDLRKTGAQWIERAHGFSVAKGWLRHSVDDHTLTYTAASPEQIARGFEALTGRRHPLAGGPASHPDVE